MGSSFTEGKKKSINKKKSVKLGIIIGLVNFIGYIALLTALKTGPLSIIAPMSGFSVMITVLLSRAVHKEELTIYQFGLVLLAILGLVLLRV